MREILFRGRRLDCDHQSVRWIEGCYVHLKDAEHEPINGYSRELHAICKVDSYSQWNNATYDFTPSWYDVDPNTIGQYTGLKDAKGKKLFEGDIVECVSWNEYFTDPHTGQMMEPFRRKAVIIFSEGSFQLEEHMPTPWNNNLWPIQYGGDLIIIGNIHDNPELLKED